MLASGVETDRDGQRGRPRDTQNLDNTNFSPQKKMKLRGTKDLSIAAVGKYGTLQEFSFFDKVTGGAHTCRTRAPGKGAGGEGARGWVWEGGLAPTFPVEGTVGRH